MRRIHPSHFAGSNLHRRTIHLQSRLRHLLLVTLLACSMPQPTRAQQTWSSIQPMISARHQHGAATGPDGKLYVVGGRVGQKCLATVERYDVQSGWSQVASMTTPRCNPGVVVGADGYLYAVGGDLGEQSTNLVERYDVATGKWETRQPLNFDRARPAVAIGPDLRIYAIGGSSQPSGKALSSIEVYDAIGDAWTLVQGAPKAGTYEAVTGLDGNIYVFSAGSPETWARYDGSHWTELGTTYPMSGSEFSAATGSDGIMYLAAIGSSNVWSGVKRVAGYGTNVQLGEQPELLESRNRPAAAAADGRLVVTGGGYKQSPMTLKLAEAYGPLQAPLFGNAAAGWRFDEPNGPTAVDVTGHTIGTFVGNVPHAAGRVSTSVAFNGKNHLAVADAPALAFGSGDFSFEGWVRWLPSGSGVTPILDKRTLVNGKYRGYSLFIYQNGRLGVQLANGSTYQNYVATSTAIKANTWTHFAAVVDRSSTKTVRLYVNGVRDDKDFVPLAGDVSNAAALTVAKHSFDNLYYRGGLDELSMHKRALTWAEVRAVFLAGKEGKQ